MPKDRYTAECEMKTLTVRLPEELGAEIEGECRDRQRSKSDVVRERLTRAPGRSRRGPPTMIADLVGSVGYRAI
jgi:hypothetical protein